MHVIKDKTFLTSDGVARIDVFKRVTNIDNVKEFIAVTINGITKISYLHKTKEKSLREYIKEALSKNAQYYRNPNRDPYAKLIKVKIMEE